VKEYKCALNKEEGFHIVWVWICALQPIHCGLHCGLPHTCVIRNTVGGMLQH